MLSYSALYEGASKCNLFFYIPMLKKKKRKKKKEKEKEKEKVD